MFGSRLGESSCGPFHAAHVDRGVMVSQGSLLGPGRVLGRLVNIVLPLYLFGSDGYDALM